jgi:hypothetical protein
MKLFKKQAGGDGGEDFQGFQDYEDQESILEVIRKKRGLLEDCFEDESFDVEC